MISPRLSPRAHYVGPNDRPAIAFGRLRWHGPGRRLQCQTGSAAVTRVCDVDAGHAAAAAQQFTTGGKTPAIFDDVRKLVERNDIQAIINATPDHWHTLVNMTAAKAGKDVYGEKPLTMTIDEGHRVISAVRKGKIVLQTGTAAAQPGFPVSAWRASWCAISASASSSKLPSGCPPVCAKGLFPPNGRRTN